MKNLDMKTMDMEQARANLFDAMRNGSDEEQMNAFEGLLTAIAEDVKNQAATAAKQASEENRDAEIIAARSASKVFTAEERKYFNAVVEKKGWEGVSEAFPVTIVENVLSQIETEHPILSKIDMVSVDGLLKFVYALPTAKRAFWGEICEDIKQLILSGFKVETTKVFKLSGFVVMCKGMLELGPTWLGEYIIRSLREIMSASLEEAVVSGTGDANKMPVGMTKSLVGVVDGKYKDKEAVAIKDFTPTSLAGVRAALAKSKMDNGQISMMVNPVDYWTKVYTGLSTRNSDGEWVVVNMPAGIEIIQSYAVPEGKVVFGNLKNYILAVSGDVRIDEYKETLAIEDLDLYIAKFYGNGRPKDKNAFFVGDISGVTGATPVKLETEPEVVPGV